jgi:hypothetical protein
LRRILTLTLVATAGCDWAESPLAPTDVGTPNFSVNFSPGDLIGTTNGGELVRIDLSTGTVTLTGDAGSTVESLAGLASRSMHRVTS